MLVYFLTLKAYKHSNDTSSSGTSRSGKSENDSGVNESDNSSTTSLLSSTIRKLDYKTEVMTEKTPLLLDFSRDNNNGEDLEENDKVFENFSCEESEHIPQSYGSMPEILKTVGFSGQGAAEV